LNRSYIIRNTIFVLLGTAGLVLKSWLSGCLPDFVLNYAGNVCVSFAVYFIVKLSSAKMRFNRVIIAITALLIVELFEATNGFGVMANTYDRLDFIANALGIALAIVVDISTERVLRNQISTS
jgi:EamA domain-containing membrane protein RarD